MNGTCLTRKLWLHGIWPSGLAGSTCYHIFQVYLVWRRSWVILNRQSGLSAQIVILASIFGTPYGLVQSLARRS